MEPKSPSLYDSIRNQLTQDIIWLIVEYQFFRDFTSKCTPFVFNIKLINDLHEIEQTLLENIKSEINRWEKNYEEKFRLENFISDYERIRADYARAIGETGTPSQDLAGTE